MIYSTTDELLSIALGSALIASNGLNIIRDNPVANKVLIIFLLIVFPLLELITVMTATYLTKINANAISILPLVVYSIIISNRNRESSVVSVEDRDKATNIAIAGLVCTIVLNLMAIRETGRVVSRREYLEE